MKSVSSQKNLLVWFRLLMKYRSQKFKRKANRLQISLLSQYLEKDSVFFDIGANKGLFTYWACRQIGKNGAVHTFEPQKELKWIFESLNRHFKKININYNDFGLSDAPSSALLARSCIGDGSASLSSVVDSGSQEAIEIQLDTLDNYCQRNEIRRIDFIKIDVEGHEFATLQGAQKTIESFRPKMLIEMSPSPSSLGNINYLKSLGYQIKMISGGQIFQSNSKFAEEFTSNSPSYKSNADMLFY